MAEAFLYFTELLNLPVYDLKHRRIGRVRDAALVPLVHQSRVDRFLVGAGSSWLSVRYDQISAISLDGIQLSDEKLFPYHSDEYMLRMGRDCSTSRSSTSMAARWSVSTMSHSTSSAAPASIRFS